MAALSPKIYEQASTAAKLLKQAERKIRILLTLNWAPEIEAGFLASGCAVLPEPVYPKFDGADTRATLAKIKPLAAGEHPVLQWLSRTVNKLEHGANMLDAVGTPDFYRHSKRLYGTPTDTMLDGITTNIDLAKHLDITLSGLSFEQLVLGGVDENFGAEEFSKRLSGKLSRYFDGNGPRVELATDLSAKVLAGSRRIRVRSDARFTPLDVRQLMKQRCVQFVCITRFKNDRRQDDHGPQDAGQTGPPRVI